MSQKARVTGYQYDIESIEHDLKDALTKLEWHEHIRTDTKVFVKPNFTLPFYKPGVTTHENLLEATLNVLKDRAAEVSVGESDGGNNSFTAEYSLRNHGIPEMCSRTGASMINLSKADRIRVAGRICGREVATYVPKPLLSVDESVSVPVLKVHVRTAVSLSIKNLWGCNPDTYRFLEHKHLSERLSLIARAIHLRFVVVDAIKGLDRYGPMDGDAVDIGAVLVGDNPVATDAVATRLMGFDPRHVKHIVVASQAGLGPYEQDEIDVIGDLSFMARKFTLNPRPLDYLDALTFRSRILSKVVLHSPLTVPIYKLLRKKPGRKIVKIGDEV